MLNKHSLLLFVLLTLVLGAFFLAGPGEESLFTDKQAVKISVSKTPLSAPFYIADEKQLFAKTCVEVELKEVVGGDKSFEQVIRGDADFGTSSGSVIVFKGMLRSDFVNLATFVQSDNDVKFVTEENSQIVSAKDLTGKKIGVTRGTAGEYFLSTYLALGGVSAEQVDINFLAPEKLGDALINDKVDIIVPWEPYAFKTMRRLKGKGVTLQTKNLYTLTFNLIASRTYLESNLEGAKCVLQGLEKAINFIASYPDEAQQILTRRLDIEQEFIDWIWPDYIFKLSLNRSLLMNLRSQATWSIERGLIDSNRQPDFKRLTDSRPLKQVNPMAVRLH